MSLMNARQMYQLMADELRTQALKHHLMDDTVAISCRQLTANEAIGHPEHQDYPIIKGKEVMVEAEFRGARGQAFTDAVEIQSYTIGELLALDLGNNATRANFVAAFNAVMRSLERAKCTIHCKDEEPVICARQLTQAFPPGTRVLLVGYQPRFLEYLAQTYPVRVVDLDPEHVHQVRFGIKVEPVEATPEAIEWCEHVLATGSTLVNETLGRFLNCGRPVTFYGTTIAGVAPLLGVRTWCRCGH